VALPGRLSREEQLAYRGHEFSVASVAVIPDGRTLAICSDDFTVRPWDAATGRQLRVLLGHQD
jgi:WD40 repeat protein